MATTEYTDTTFAVGSIQARTDAGGSDVVDVNGEELRLYASAFTPGVLAVEHFPVNPGPAMSVEVGSGTPETDVAYIAGVVGQGIYVVRHGLGTTNITVPASDLSNSRIDEVYVMVADDPYDSSTLALPRLALRVGDPSVSPEAPGPDPGWSASLLLAALDIQAASTTVEAVDITDRRVTAGLAFNLDATDFDGVLQSVFDAHVDDFDQHVLTAAATFLPLAGGTMSGPIHLIGDGATALFFDDNDQTGFNIRQTANGDLHFRRGLTDWMVMDQSGGDEVRFNRQVDMDSNEIRNIADPANSGAGMSRGYADLRYLGIGDGYDDADAVAAMGPVGDGNDLNHNRYSDADAVAATDNAQIVTGGVASTTTVQDVSTDAYVVVASFSVPRPAGWASTKVVARGFLQQANVADANMQLQAYLSIDGVDGPSVQDGVETPGGDPSVSAVASSDTTQATIDIVVWARNALVNASNSVGKYADVDYALYRVS